jgi:hypothetical protein
LAPGALGVLRGLAGLLETGLLALDDAGVAGQEAGLLQRRAVVLGVDRVQRTGDAEAQGAGLAGDAAAGDARDDVEATLDVHELQRGVHELLVHLVREVVLDGAAVDLPLAGAGDQAHARDGLLATAEGLAGSGQALATPGGRSGLGGVAGGRLAALKVDVDRGLGHWWCPRVLSGGERCRPQACCATWVISKGFGC